MNDSIYNGVTKGTSFIKYNIYLNSPQLALQANNKKYYQNVIIQNQQNMNKTINRYPPSYFKTSYNSYYLPNRIVMPSL